MEPPAGAPTPPPYARRAAEDRALLGFIRAALADLRRELARDDLLNGVRMADRIAQTCIDKINTPR